ncbi:uncharacterized protein [Branchiostoma lanceolatum]|uniref:uncharacterized protein n=1 Tax=Branchiostoma lanceolatum TaxID=7740 RepID=UPI0034540BCC
MSREAGEVCPSLQEREARFFRQKTRTSTRHLQCQVGELEQQTRRVDHEIRSEQFLLLCHFRNLRKNMDKAISLSSRRKLVRRKARSSALPLKPSSTKLTTSSDGCSEEGGDKKTQDKENVSTCHEADDCDQADPAKKDLQSEGRLGRTTKITQRRFSVPVCTAESLPQLQHQKKGAKTCKLVQRRRHSLPAIQPRDKERHELREIAEEEEVETMTTRRRLSVPVESLRQLQRHKDYVLSSKGLHRRRHTFPAIQLSQDREELQTVVEGDEPAVDKTTSQLQIVETRNEAIRKASTLLRQRLFPTIVTPVLDVNNSSVQPTEQKIQLPSKFEPESAFDSNLEKKSPPKTGWQRRVSDGTAVKTSHAEHFHRRRSFPALCVEHCTSRLHPEPRTGHMTPWHSIFTKSKTRIYSISVESGYVIKV